MHPTARIVLYLFSALAVPGLSFFGLGMVLAGALIGVARRLKHVASLLWRTRWLFLLLFLGNAWGHPGEPVLLDAGRLSPTWEGVTLGASHVLRLLTILLLLDLLVLAMPREPQLSGIHGLLRPLACLGLDAGRATVRLGLTLQALELPAAERRRLRDLFSDAGRTPEQPEQPEQPEHFELEVLPWGRADVVSLLSGITLLGLLWLYA